VATSERHHLAATTELVGLIGHPVRHSLSPVLMNTAFREMGLDWAFVVCEVSPGLGAAAVSGAATLGFRGLSVTMPHKDAAAASVDELSPSAAALGAVNCVAFADGRAVGHNTDGAGFLASLSAETGRSVAGEVCAVLGAGGAARSIVRALADAGAGEVLVVNRTESRALAAAGVAPDVARVAAVDEIGAAAVVVNATSVGMADASRPGAVGDVPIDVGRLSTGTLVADIVYHPRRTALLSAARSRGLETLGGLGMLVHQAAAAIEIWTGRAAPIAAMTEGAEAVLATRS
jgi:shikimate dehydrogenase